MKDDKIKIELDSAQVLYYLEGCAHGSHLRQCCWHDMIRLYPKMTQGMRDFLYTYAKRDIAPVFKPYREGKTRPCGAADFDQFLACFDKDNRYMVTANFFGEETTKEAYLYKGTYYTTDISFFEEEYIAKIEKIGHEND